MIGDKGIWCFLLFTPLLRAIEVHAGRILSGPTRVRISDFTLSISPGDPFLSVYGAKDVRDVAESLFESFLLSRDWGPHTFYDYAGLSGIENVTFEQTTSSSVSVITIRGGMVVFDSTTMMVPSTAEIEGILRESLFPLSADQVSLMDMLEATTNFEYIERIQLSLVHYPTFMPSLSPTDWSSFAPVSSPSLAPQTNPNALSKGSTNNVTSPTTHLTSHERILGIMAAGLVLTVAAAAGIFYHRRSKRRQAWKLDAPHQVPIGLHQRDSLQQKGDDKSESSFLGRVLCSTSPRAMLTSSSPETTPHSDSEDGSSLSDFGDDMKTITPTILQLSSIQDEEGYAKAVDISVAEKSLDEVPSVFDKWSEYGWNQNPYESDGLDEAATWDFDDTDKEEAVCAVEEDFRITKISL